MFNHFASPGVAVRDDRMRRALGLADTTIDAFRGVDDNHVLSLVVAADRAHLHAVQILSFDVIIRNNVGHSNPFFD